MNKIIEKIRLEKIAFENYLVDKILETRKKLRLEFSYEPKIEEIIAESGLEIISKDVISTFELIRKIEEYSE